MCFTEWHQTPFCSTWSMHLESVAVVMGYYYLYLHCIKKDLRIGVLIVLSIFSNLLEVFTLQLTVYIIYFLNCRCWIHSHVIRRSLEKKKYHRNGNNDWTVIARIRECWSIWKWGVTSSVSSRNPYTTLIFGIVQRLCRRRNIHSLCRDECGKLFPN